MQNRVALMLSLVRSFCYLLQNGVECKGLKFGKETKSEVFISYKKGKLQRWSRYEMVKATFIIWVCACVCGVWW